MMIAGVVLAQAPSLVFSGPLTMVATSDSRTGAAVAVGDDEIAVLIGAAELVVARLMVEACAGPVEVALRRIDVLVAIRGANVVDVEAISPPAPAD